MTEVKEMEVNETGEAVVVKKKKTTGKRNRFVRWFVPFGLRQATHLLFLASFIVLIVGIGVYAGSPRNEWVLVAGIIAYGIACAMAITQAVMVMMGKGINKKSPEYKKAVVNLVIMSVMFALAVFGTVAAFLWA